MASLDNPTLYASPRPPSLSLRVPHDARRHSLHRLSQSHSIDIVSPELFLGEARYSGILKPVPDMENGQHLMLLDVDFELRHPPVDPRKGRRHCLNFGFGRSEEQSPTVLSPDLDSPTHDESLDDISLSVPSPSETCTDTGSETDYSSLKDIEMEFPEPPSMSPMLRRMRSSPSFTEATHVFRQSHAQAARSSAVCVPPALKLVAEATSAPAIQSSFHEAVGLVNSPAKDLEDKFPRFSSRRNSVACEKTHRVSKTESSIHVSPRLRRQSTPSNQCNHLLDTRNASPPPALYHNESPDTLKVIRRVSSVMNPKIDTSLAPLRSRTIHKMRSLKFRSSNSLVPRTESKPKPARSLLKGRSVSMEFSKAGASASHMSAFFHSHTKPSHHRAHMSASAVFSDGKNMFASPFPQQDTTADGPFRHKKGGLESFMDISPEENKFSREGLRRLWQKASASIIEWSRGLSQK